jgi:cytochrome P450
MLKLSAARAEVVVEWATEFPREVALELAGVPEDEVKKIMDKVAKVGVLEDPKNPEPVAPTPAATKPAAKST